ncbi:acyl carrier protein [Saccharopolyspora sp. NPDC050642]|uniref:acyl carrier protein n=1 Tax=Saccharopolyspora sp. NPDC050642 TaxID=3157099 RepID=UPI0033D2CA39
MPDTDATPIDPEDLRRIVAEVLDVEVSDVTDDARFVEDLGGDSLLALEVIVVLEKKYGVKFTEPEVQGLTSLPKTHDLLAAKLGGA